MSPTLVEARLLTLLSLAEQSHTFVTAVLSMMSRWSVGSLAVWRQFTFIYLLLLSGFFTYLLTHSPSLSSTPSCTANQSSKLYMALGRAVCTSHRQSVSQSVRSSLGIEGFQTLESRKQESQKAQSIPCRLSLSVKKGSRSNTDIIMVRCYSVRIPFPSLYFVVASSNEISFPHSSEHSGPSIPLAGCGRPVPNQLPPLSDPLGSRAAIGERIEAPPVR